MKKQVLTSLFTLLSLCTFAQQENSLYFDNIDDYVQVPSASSLISGSAEMSLTFWVYPENAAPVYPDYDGFAGFRNNTDADFYVLQLTATGIEARFRNSSGTPYDAIYSGLQLNVWQHFAFVYDGTDIKLYHNGALVASTPASGTIASTTVPLNIGMTEWTGNNFFTNGKMDEVSLWDKALTPAEISCMQTGAVDPTTTGLQLYYRFNQGTAGGANGTVNSLANASGTNNGTLMGFSLAGSVSNWVGGVSLPNSSFVTDALCPGATYTLGSQTITQPGMYFEAFPGSGTCDSVVQLVLTSPVINTTISQAGPILMSQQAGAAYQWIDCNGNTPIPGATAQTYTATANGQYAVIVTLSGCSDTSVCANVVNVGIADINSQLALTASNPFTDELSIRFTDSMLDMVYEVIDASGRKIHDGVITNSDVRLYTSDWKRGIYMLSVQNSGARVKLVKL